MGSVDPLEAARKYLDDRHRRRQDRTYREREEERQLSRENEQRELELTQRRLELGARRLSAGGWGRWAGAAVLSRRLEPILAMAPVPDLPQRLAGRRSTRPDPGPQS